jgi:hypothetical protein
MADTKQTITDFYRVAGVRDFARDFQFRVQGIDGIPELSGPGAGQEEDLVYIRGASLPGRTIASHNVPYMGLQFHVPGSVSYPDSGNWSVTFYCDQKSTIRQKLERSMQTYFDDDTSTGDYRTPGAGAVITLVQLDHELDPVATYKLVGAFPTTVGAMNYSIGDGSGAPVTFDASFSYQYWRRTSASNAE